MSESSPITLTSLLSAQAPVAMCAPFAPPSWA